MPLLLAYRRWWCVILTALLLLPAFGLLLPDMPTPLRTVAGPAEKWWAQATTRLDPFINNNFGLRGVIMAANAAYSRATHSTRSRPLVVGEHGQLIYTGDQALAQSLGQLVRMDSIERLEHMMETLDHTLAARGAKLVVTSPPNNATSVADKLPEWARAQIRHPTEMDIVARELTQRGVTFVDLRPPLAEAAKTGPIYRRTDTHWNWRSAVIAFNAAMAGAGRSDLEIPLDTAVGPLIRVPSGDLGRMIGDVDPTGDTDYQQLPIGRDVTLTPLPGIMPESPPGEPFPAVAFSTGHAGPSILVIGDSFTQYPWRPLLAARASRFAWMHVASCKFEWDAIERFRPDIVIYASTERALPCKWLPPGMPAGG